MAQKINDTKESVLLSFDPRSLGKKSSHNFLNNNPNNILLNSRTISRNTKGTREGEYVKGMEKLSKLAGLDHQNAIVFSVLIGEIKALEKKNNNNYKYCITSLT